MPKKSSKKKKNKRGGGREGTPGASDAGPASSHAAAEEDTKPVDMEVVEEQVRTEEEESAPTDKDAAGRQSSQSPASSPSRGSWREVMTRDTDAKLRENFIKFIKRYTYPGHNSPSFKSRVVEMAEGGSTKLQIMFSYLMDGYRQNEELLGLCLKIGNTNRTTWTDWLAVTINDLLEKDWIEDARSLDLTRKVEIEFLAKPLSIIPYKTLLVKEHQPNAKWVSVLAGRRKVYAATNHGKLPFKAAITSLVSLFREDKFFEMVRKDQCFEKGFEIKEFFLVNNQSCYICKTPKALSSLGHHSRVAAKKFIAEAKVNNAASLWKMFEPYYILGDGELPIYFEILKADLTCVTTEMVTEDWYLLYLERHFTWASSMCRKAFSCDSPLVNKIFDFAAMSSVMAEKPAVSDWREEVWQSNDNILNGVYWYGIRLEDYGLQGIELHIQRGEYHKISLNDYKRVRQNTISGLLEYKRNLIQHLKDHLNREAEKDKIKDRSKKAEKYKINDFDELELFASSSLARPEPTVLKHLVKNHCEEFESLMSFYKAGLSDTKDLPRS